MSCSPMSYRLPATGFGFWLMGKLGRAWVGAWHGAWVGGGVCEGDDVWWGWDNCMCIQKRSPKNNEMNSNVKRPLREQKS